MAETTPRNGGLDRGSLLAALTAASMLAAQVLVHRLVSLKFMNNYAFLVISLTMLGFGLSGVWLGRSLGRFQKKPNEAYVSAAACFGATLVGSAAILLGAAVHSNVMDGGVPSRAAFVASFFRSIPFALIFAVPFTFGGLVLGALLSAPEYPTRRVYFFDLMGSAFGAFVILPVINAIGVENALVGVGLLQIVGTCVLFPPREPSSRGLAAAGAALLVFAGVARSEAFHLHAPDRYEHSPTRGVDRSARLLSARWDSLGRAELWSIDGAPPQFALQALFGDDPAYRSRFRRVLTQNNWAFTYAPHLDVPAEELHGVARSMYAASYLASSVPSPRVAIVGVGGGTDVIAALHFGAREIDGVEANGATLAMVREVDRTYFERWAADPRVHLHHDEGRHFLAAASGRYDVVQLSGVDTYAGTPGAAHVFTENYLYTLEAFSLYLSRLTDNGILTVVRLEWPPPREGIRALATMVAALRGMDVAHPSENVIIVGTPDKLHLALMAKRTAFTEAEEAKLAAGIAGNPLLRIVASPRQNVQHANIYQSFLSLDDSFKEDVFLLSAPANITPVDDDRPFYFHFSSFANVFPPAPGTWAPMPTMEYNVLLLVLVIGVIAATAIWLPVRRLGAASTATLPSSSLERRDVRRFALYFAALGMGFMGIEMGLLAHFGVLLGHPSYALSVVLAVLLFATGTGALFAERIADRLGGVRFVAYLLAALLFVEVLLIFPRLAPLQAASFAVRCTVTALLILPIGVCLGVFLPTGLENLKGRAPTLVPWAWGINGVFSVLGPIVAIATSITFGTRALMMITVPIYLVAGWILPGRPARPSESLQNLAP